MTLKFPRKVFLSVMAATALISINGVAQLSGNAEMDAKVLYQRLAGVPLRKENPLYNNLISLVAGGQLEQAAALITNPQSGAVSFYETTVRNIASTYNRYESSLQAKLNDFMALFIGIVRDSDGVNVKVDDVLTANYLYNDPTVGNPNTYNAGNNTHFEFIAGRPQGFARQLVKFTPADFAHVGAFDTRTFGEEFSKGGTLRRPFEALIQLFFAVSQKSVMMTDLPSDQYRRDFPRSVAGVPIEMNTTPLCIGCHRGMDGATRVFLNRHWNDAQGKIVIVASTAADFDQVNEENRPEQLATSTVGKLYVTKEMNDKVFGYQGLNPRSGFLEGDIASTADLMRFVVGSRGYHRGFAKRIAFYMYTGRLFSLSEQKDADIAILKDINSDIEALTDSLMQHKNLRKTFEEAAIRWIKS